MRTYLFLLASMLVLCFIRCDQEETNVNVTPASVTFSSCIYSPAKDIFPDSVTMRLTGREGDKLMIRLANTEFCCGTDSVSINSSIDGNAIRIEIIDQGPHTYCYCPHNLEFTIGPLNNENYTLSLIESEHAYSRDTFNIAFAYSQQLDTTITGSIGIDMIRNNPLNLENTILGGCNGLDESENIDSEFPNDTIIFYEHPDTLQIYVGVNEPCCIDFESESSINGDTLVMKINTLYDPGCDCMCYYTFDYYFSNYSGQGFYYQFYVDEHKRMEGTYNLPMRVE